MSAAAYQVSSSVALPLSECFVLSLRGLSVVMEFFEWRLPLLRCTVPLATAFGGRPRFLLAVDDAPPPLPTTIRFCSTPADRDDSVAPAAAKAALRKAAPRLPKLPIDILNTQCCTLHLKWVAFAGWIEMQSVTNSIPHMCTYKKQKQARVDTLTWNEVMSALEKCIRHRTTCIFCKVLLYKCLFGDEYHLKTRYKIGIHEPE